MSAVRTTKADIAWNYVGTVVSMASGFVLLPLLLAFLTADELGLWYVYVAVGNLVALFEFGFNPTFARNIVYVVSGARRLSAKGCDAASVEPGVDWHLLNVVVRAAQAVYAAIAAVSLLLLATAGTAYIVYVAGGMEAGSLWVSWALFVVAMVLNLYFLWSTTLLRGLGDVAGENRARTFAKLSQLAVSAVLLVGGAGLVGAAIGYLANALLMRLLAMLRLRSHAEVRAGRRSDARRVSLAEVRGAVATVGHIAWRDGLVQLACYASTQATTVMASLFLGLAETGTYSVLLQLATAVYNFAGAYPKSFFPAMQAAFAEGDGGRQRHIASTGLVAYWALIAFGTTGVCLVILPLLPLFKPGFAVDYALFLGLTAYLALWNHHSICCNYIISRNEIPYMAGYIVAAGIGVALVWVLCGWASLGAWGIVAGQALSQIVYNNWKWPRYIARKLETTYPALVRDGARWWKAKLRRFGGGAQ